MNISTSIEINSSTDRVWYAITDIENAQDRLSEIVSLKVLEKPDEGLVGLKWTETRKVFGKEATETMWITEYEDGKYYQTRAENHGAVYISRLSLSPVGENTLLTMSFEGTSESFWVRLISGCFGFLMKGSMVKLIEKDLADIKHYVENELGDKLL